MLVIACEYTRSAAGAKYRNGLVWNRTASPYLSQGAEACAYRPPKGRDRGLDGSVCMCAVRGGSDGRRPPQKAAASGNCRSQRFGGEICGLEELLSLLVFQGPDDFADVLSLLPRTNEQRIRRINHHKVTHADGRDEFIRTPQEIALGIDGMTFTCKNILAGMLCDEFIDRSPRADVAPADVRGDHKDPAGAIFARGVFQDGVVHGDILEFPVNSLQLGGIA